VIAETLGEALRSLVYQVSLKVVTELTPAAKSSPGMAPSR